jgi:hypothetical protein
MLRTRRPFARSAPGATENDMFRRVLLMATLVSCAVTGVVCIPTMSAASPSVTILSLQKQGVVLLPSTHQDFVNRSSMTNRAPECGVLDPYTVLIANQTDREIIAYTVLWHAISPEGKVTTQTRAVFDFSDLRPGNHLGPKDNEFVYILPVIEAGKISNSATQATIDHEFEFYSRQKAVQITLDAVLFADGVAIGPDESGWIDRWRAWLDAEQTVFTDAITPPAGHAIPIMQAHLEPALQRHIQLYHAEPPDAGRLAILADHAADYQECLDWAKGYFALRILKDMERSGDGAVKLNLTNILRLKAYPRVRKEMK